MKTKEHRVCSSQGFEASFTKRKDAEDYAQELVETVGIQAWVEPTAKSTVSKG